MEGMWRRPKVRTPSSKRLHPCRSLMKGKSIVIAGASCDTVFNSLLHGGTAVSSQLFAALLQLSLKNCCSGRFGTGRNVISSFSCFGHKSPSVHIKLDNVCDE
ncbi:hypothetical protein EYF80_015590 [Liparis tanakae]|uniref:Uncharacterized protein n=1 Tax=Liparis tanakae TaxID=230148 RepID=A0A4Z2I9R5_9TELE|nr:hypothetical protein EYF80_015590 [Liparis tanakae]